MLDGRNGDGLGLIAERPVDGSMPMAPLEVDRGLHRFADRSEEDQATRPFSRGNGTIFKSARKLLTAPSLPRACYSDFPVRSQRPRVNRQPLLHPGASIHKLRAHRRDQLVHIPCARSVSCPGPLMNSTVGHDSSAKPRGRRCPVDRNVRAGGSFAIIPPIVARELCNAGQNRTHAAQNALS